ncbi:chemotaxis protein CheB [Methylobacterium durans]|uniref:chemotaxis protein CheB n=1 Tax=Methylobacterium durans TaxID=2202825 RepID=UPI002AFF5066|nr:chemotaxis protein CheB [Methylobacterium durans]MEA1835198.1 chemotaxis protein CheB [Methylobacterium durans]
MPRSEPDGEPGFYVAIGASGPKGLDDIQRLLARLPRDLPAVVLICVHRPFDKVSHLREILQRHSPLPIHLAQDCERLLSGRGYIGEPDAHLCLAERGLCGLIADPENLHRNRTVDVLFRSIAEHAPGRFIGVVLSGGLDDGARGLAAIHEAGGLTMVLTPQPAPAMGMPENAIRYDGPIDFIGSPEAIAAKITERAREAARPC